MCAKNMRQRKRHNWYQVKGVSVLFIHLYAYQMLKDYTEY